ncbi:uncharacterized protein LOC128736785 [Sabethes cyaneus]|uniref:uncharacterized protein LOC128736785 n=1 Tax=Sabethes cyaneus TaxID=53552 RepID=UPI00237E0758|nr:uncharacterized protein LOC128736785 [Sabethes cyaneus]
MDSHHGIEWLDEPLESPKFMSLDIDYDLGEYENQNVVDGDEEHLVTFEEEAEDDPMKLFRFTAHILKRNFKGHKKGPAVGKIKVNCNTAEEVLELLWNTCKSHIKREVIFDAAVGGGDDSYSARWAETVSPTIAEIDKFLTFQDKQSKRIYKLSQLKEKPERMQKYMDKEVNLFVYVYSESITSANMYDTLRVQLLNPEERDRSGAASNQAVSVLVTELKNLHKGYYISQDINWTVWASFLYTKDALERDELKLQGPPQHLIHLFKTVPSASQRCLSSTRNDIRIAQNVNGGYKEELDTLMKELDQVCAALSSMKLRLTALRTMQATNESVLYDVSESMEAHEDIFGEALAKQVTNCTDVDHL